MARTSQGVLYDPGHYPFRGVCTGGVCRAVAAITRLPVDLESDARPFSLLFASSVAMKSARVLPKLCRSEQLTILQCQDHKLCVLHQMLSVFLLNVLPSLGLNLVDKGAQQIDSCFSLTTILCRLGCIELGQQTVRHSLVIDEAFCGGMLDTCC